MNLSNIAILNIIGADCRCIIIGISKSKAKFRFDQKKRNIIKHKKLLSHIKMGNEVLNFGNIEIEEINFTTMKVLFF